jgi:hypothetical protein
MQISLSTTAESSCTFIRKIVWLYGTSSLSVVGDFKFRVSVSLLEIPFQIRDVVATVVLPPEKFA